ncbi:MAG TPA: BatA domain-containing protein [Gemmatimonadaceae bacterium]
MSWLNPAAFGGLLALAVPILVHLFGRRLARRARFPSLRLLRDARPRPATRSRPSDVLLLVVRCAVILAAVLALAQPMWLDSERARTALIPVRAILVDTSPSMRRLTSDSTSALQRARALGQRMLDSAREGIIVETLQPGASVAGAASWLQAHSGVRELVIISDFQAGALVDGQLASVAQGIGIRLVKVSVSSVAPGSAEASGGIVRLGLQPNRTDATWATSPEDTTLPIVVLAPAEDAGLVQASVAAVRAIAPRPGSSARKVAVVFPRYSGRRELAAGVAALNSPWQGDRLMALGRDRLLTDAAASARVTPSCDHAGVAIAHNASGEVVATMAGGSSATDYDVLVFACVEVGTVAGTALLASVVAAVQTAPSLQELEPVVVPDEALRGWERPASEPGPRVTEDTSPDGRWFWLVAIAFLLAEEWLRRRAPRRAPLTVTEAPHERVA